MLLIPFAAFWLLVFMGRDELGPKGVIFCITLWVVLLFGFMNLELPSYWFVAAQALIDAILIIVICGGDIRIR
jgi:hypothetical protein